MKPKKRIIAAAPIVPGATARTAAISHPSSAGQSRTMGAIRKILALPAALLILGLSLLPSAQASVAWGSINNFDTVNDTGVECHGFEIEIEGVHSRDITYTFDWNHYGAPRITEDSSDPLHPRVFIRYAGVRNPDGTWTAYTAVPAAPITPTDGHQFVNPSVNFGGEHFGVGYYGVPGAIKYSWLKDDGAGNLIFAGAVNIATPTFTYFPPVGGNQPAEVVAAIVPPPPPEPPVLRHGPASWIKDTKTKTHNNRKVELRDLVSDDPNDPNDRNWQNGEPDEVETEWRILQTEFGEVEGGKNGKHEGAAEELPEGDEVITRRYDFFQYVGPIDAESGEAMADEVAADGIHGVGTVTYNHHIDPATGEWVEMTVDLSEIVVVGDYIGAQMAGFDAAAQIGLIDHLQDGEAGVAYVERSIVIGGTPPVVTTRTGALPDGMVFDEVTGVLSGTPTVAGTFTFDVHSTDANAGDVTATYHLTILEGFVEPPHITVTTLVSPVAGGSASGDGEYLTGDTVTVVAFPSPGYSFVNWTDGGAIVSLSDTYEFTAEVNRGLVANFAPITYAIAASASPAAGGSVSGEGVVDSGAVVTLVAAANPGYTFANWTENGAVVSGLASYTFTADASRSLTANFTPVPKPGDVNNDGQVTSADLALIVAARNKPASGPNDPRDLDHDGKITVLDARIEAILINRANR